MPNGTAGASVNKRKRGGGGGGNNNNNENGGGGAAGGAGRGGGGGRGGRGGNRRGGRGGRGGGQPRGENGEAQAFARPQAADDMEAEEDMIVESLGEVEVADGTTTTTTTTQQNTNKNNKNKNKKQKTTHDSPAPVAATADDVALGTFSHLCSASLCRVCVRASAVDDRVCMKGGCVANSTAAHLYPSFLPPRLLVWHVACVA
jgi:hypothetical protein